MPGWPATRRPPGVTSLTKLGVRDGLSDRLRQLVIGRPAQQREHGVLGDVAAGHRPLPARAHDGHVLAGADYGDVADLVDLPLPAADLSSAAVLHGEEVLGGRG